MCGGEPGLHEAQTKQIPRAVDEDSLVICTDKFCEPTYYGHEVDHKIAAGESGSKEIENRQRIGGEIKEQKKMMKDMKEKHSAAVKGCRQR